MQPGQRIPRLRVIKLRDADDLPSFVVVTTQTVLPQAAVVLVLVTTHAILREPQKRAIQVLALDQPTLVRSHVLRRMTAAAFQAGVFSFQRVSGLAMIERLDVPFDQRKIFAVVLGVAAGALAAGTRSDVIGGMQTFPRCDPRGNFGVALHALEFGFARAQPVTTGAVGGPAERLMRARERPRRDLRRCRHSQHQDSNAQDSPAA